MHMDQPSPFTNEFLLLGQALKPPAFCAKPRDALVRRPDTC